MGAVFFDVGGFFFEVGFQNVAFAVTVVAVGGLIGVRAFGIA